MKIFGSKDNPYNAVDALIKHGIVAIEGTKGPAIEYSNRVRKCLEPYEDIAPMQGYKNVKYNGYLYYIYDNNKFNSDTSELDNLISYIDSENK